MTDDARQRRLDLALRSLREAVTYFLTLAEEQDRHLAELRRDFDATKADHAAQIAQLDADNAGLRMVLAERNGEVAWLGDALAHVRHAGIDRSIRARKTLARQIFAGRAWRWLGVFDSLAFRSNGAQRYWLRVLAPETRFSRARRLLAPTLRQAFHLLDTQDEIGVRPIPAGPTSRPAEAAAPVSRVAEPDYQQRIRALIGEGRLHDIREVVIVAPLNRRAVVDVLLDALGSIGVRGVLAAWPACDVPAALYLVVDPQMCPQLPPADQRIVVLPDADPADAPLDGAELKKLAASLAIFDAGIDHIHRLQQRGISVHQTFYVPFHEDDDTPLGTRYLLLRALQGCGVLDYERLAQATRETRLDSERIILCLPEARDRFLYAQGGTQHGAVLFPGLRDPDGWKGTAFSYRYLAERVLRQGGSRLIVWEDDAELGADFDARLANVIAYLDQHDGVWDVFSGLLTDLSDGTEVTSVDLRREELLVGVDSVIGMVFGIYNHTALKALAAYRITGEDAARHTIDRYLESRSMACLTLFPPLVRHARDLSSTLWLDQSMRFVLNEAMEAMIRTSQARVIRNIARFLAL